tara:strand:- start:969 stop:1160 length:192 start_codon:yes stop_codon:yes gene_type:complete
MDNVNMMKMFLALGGLTAQTMEEKVKYKEKIVFATPGIIKPKDWDTLSMDEKLSRLNKLSEVS